MSQLKSYLLAFNEGAVSRHAMTAYLDTRVEVKNWQFYLPGTIVVTSDRTTGELVAMIHMAFPVLHFLITELIPTEVQGWLPNVVWDFICNPKPSWLVTPQFQIGPPPSGTPPWMPPPDTPKLRKP